MTDSADKDKRLTKWADPAMYTAEPLSANTGPTVTLLNMTPDPLGAIAAATLIYEGKVIRDLADVTDVDRKRCLEQLQNTRLQSPFEYVDFHFLIEGVTRSFTHQLVRQRVGASYSQESLRFAVKEDAADGVALPPSLAGTKSLHEQVEDYRKQFPGTGIMSATEDVSVQASEKDRMRWRWDDHVKDMADTYDAMIDSGMPAEDARGLLPHSITTRIHYKTTLRGLLEHAGNRLCTQAQFEWKTVIAMMIKAIRNYNPYDRLPMYDNYYNKSDNEENMKWQYDEIANMFRPICFTTGKCEFTASFDRPCKIKNRVDANHELNRPSSEWDEEYDFVPPDTIVSGFRPQSVVRDESNRPVFIGAIRPEEWLADPYAAREKK